MDETYLFWTLRMGNDVILINSNSPLGELRYRVTGLNENIVAEIRQHIVGRIILDQVCWESVNTMLQGLHSFKTGMNFLGISSQLQKCTNTQILT